MEKITKDSTIADIINNNPETAEVFMKYGFPCVGCAFSGHETIEQGALYTHGMDEKFLKKILSELNFKIQKKADTK